MKAESHDPNNQSIFQKLEHNCHNQDGNVDSVHKHKEWNLANNMKKDKNRFSTRACKIPISWEP